MLQSIYSEPSEGTEQNKVKQDSPIFQDANIFNFLYDALSAVTLVIFTDLIC
jgi:hypothetical protein